MLSSVCSRWEGVNLRELVCTELAFCAQKGSALIHGQDVELVADAVQPVAMVLHELATNATKYGALANGRGRICTLATARAGACGCKLVLEWRETAAARQGAANAAGYGMYVIRDLIPMSCHYELTGEAVQLIG